MGFGSTLFACTAIVLGTTGDYKDAQLGDPHASSSSSGDSSGGTSSTSSTSSSGSKPDPCSLLTPQRSSYNTEYPDNECAQCIKSSCSDDISYACGDGKSKKDWFSNLASCAQNPWVQYPKPGSSGSFWECGQYDKPTLTEIPGEDDQHYRRKSELCVRDNCLKDSGAPCRLCEVNIGATSSSGDNLLLRDDRCGSCFTDKCNQVIIDCCTSRVIDDYIAKCANTRDSMNLDTCKKIADADGGAVADEHGSGGNRYDPEEWACVGRFAACWQKNCASKPDCQ